MTELIGPILFTTAAATIAITAAVGLKDVRANARLERALDTYTQDPPPPEPPKPDLPLIRDDEDIPPADPRDRLERAITRMREFAARTPSQAAHDLVARKIAEAEEALIDLSDTGTLTTTRGARAGVRAYSA